MVDRLAKHILPKFIFISSRERETDLNCRQRLVLQLFFIKPISRFCFLHYCFKNFPGCIWGRIMKWWTECPFSKFSWFWDTYFLIQIYFFQIGGAPSSVRKVGSSFAACENDFFQSWCLDHIEKFEVWSWKWGRDHVWEGSPIVQNWVHKWMVQWD